MAHSRLHALLFVLTLIAVAPIAQPRAVLAAEPATMAIAPAAASATVGDEISLDITAANVPVQPGAGGYLIVLKWDPAVLSLTSLVDAGWVTSGQIIVVCTNATIDNTAGGAEADCTPVVGFGAGVSTATPQALAHAKFHAKAPGTSAIELAGSDPPSSLLNPSNSDILTTLAGASVTVSAAVGAAATDTPAPQSTSTSAVATATLAAAGTPVSTVTAAPANSTAISASPSTKPTQATLSKVEVPRTGSGSDGSTGGAAWWIPALTAVGAVLLGIGGWTAFRWSRK